MRTRPPSGVLVVSAVVAALTLLPLAYLLVRATEQGWEAALAGLLRPRTFEMMANSVVLVVIVSVGCLVLGIATAWVIARVKLPVQRLWPVLATLPLAIPSYVVAFTWLAFWPGVNGLLPLSAIMILASVPYVTIPVFAALQLTDNSLIDVARTLGRSPTRIFFTITVPQILPAALAGTLLAALYTLSEFGAVAMMRFPALTWGVYSLYEGTFDRSLAAVLSFILVVLALLLVWGEGLARRRAQRAVPAVAARIKARVEFGRLGTTFITLGLTALAVVSLVFPISVLFARLAEGSRFVSDATRLFESAVATLGLGVAAAVIAVMLALPVSYLAARYRSRAVGLIETLSFAGHALPGVVVGLALVFVSIGLMPELYQSAIVLIAAYVILYLPKSIGASRSAIGLVSPRTEEVSRTMGHGALRTWWSITGAQAWPGIAAGGLLVMVTVMKELPATLMLRPIGVETLATELWSKTTLGAYGAAAPSALLLIAMASLPAWFLSRPRRAR